MTTDRYFWKPPTGAQTTEEKSDGEATQWEPVRLGFIGLGLMGTANLERFAAMPTHICALCDVDRERARRAEALVRESGSAPVTVHTDFRELCESADLEALVISTPDHWHADIAVAAMEHGKDIYLEKPLSLTIAAGRRIADAEKRTKRIVQTGSQQRSSGEFRKAAALVRSGALGRLERIEATLPPNNVDPPADLQPAETPSELDYNLWLGPAPWRAYHPALTHYNFRFISDYSGGQMTNWGAHHLDVVQWALDKDRSGPVGVVGSGEFHESGPFDTATFIDVRYTYEGGLPVRCSTTSGQTGVEFYGSEGVLRVGRGRLDSEPASLKDQQIDPSEYGIAVSENHYRDFLSAVRSRTQPVAPAETGHRSATVCHLGNIALALGRRLRWDPERECFPDDDEANALLDRSAREWRRGSAGE